MVRPESGSASSDLAYQTLRCNVDLLKLIQLGLSFTDGQGNWAEGCTCWQFNFKFSLTDDMFAQDSIDLLKTSGIDFEAFQNYGVDVHYFGELMMMSGLALSDDVKWLTFHCSYDFGYLLNETWCEKKSINTNISNIYIDRLYKMGIKNGALGGKLLGAGNGGFLLFYVPKKNKDKFLRNFKKNICQSIRFYYEGSKIIHNS